MQWGSMYVFHESSKINGHLQQICQRLKAENVENNHWKHLFAAGASGEPTEECSLGHTERSSENRSFVKLCSKSHETHYANCAESEKGLDESDSKDTEYLESSRNKSYMQTENDMGTEQDNENLLQLDLPCEERCLLRKLMDDLRFRNLDTLTLLGKNELLDGINVFSFLSPVQATVVCKMLNFESLSETGVALMCSSLCNSDVNMSSSTGIVVCQFLILPKILSVQAIPSRELIKEIISFLKAHPNVIIDGLIHPCVKCGKLENQQLDVILEIIAVTILQEHVDLCLRKIVSGYEVHPEQMVAMLCELLKKEPKLSRETTGLLTSWLKIASESLSNDLKFAKLVLDVLNLYGPEMEIAEINEMDEVVSGNKTFLKMTAQAILQKLLGQ